MFRGYPFNIIEHILSFIKRAVNKKQLTLQQHQLNILRVLFHSHFNCLFSKVELGKIYIVMYDIFEFKCVKEQHLIGFEHLLKFD